MHYILLNLSVLGLCLRISLAALLSDLFYCNSKIVVFITTPNNKIVMKLTCSKAGYEPSAISRFGPQNTLHTWYIVCWNIRSRLRMPFIMLSMTDYILLVLVSPCMQRGFWQWTTDHYFHIAICELRFHEFLPHWIGHLVLHVYYRV